MNRPLLFLDVDGVVNPYAAPRLPDGFIEHRFLVHDEVWHIAGAEMNTRWVIARLNPAFHGPLLNGLATDFDLVWASSWGNDANVHPSPLLGLPPLPVVVPAPCRPRVATKVWVINEFARGRALAWIDDDPAPSGAPDAFQWARSRRGGKDGRPTLIVRTDPAKGMTKEHADELHRFARSLQGA